MNDLDQEVNKDQELELTFEEKCIFTTFLLFVVGILFMVGYGVYTDIDRASDIELQENNLKDNSYNLVDLDWNESFDDYGVRKVFAKKLLDNKDKIQDYPKDSILIYDSNNVYYLTPIGVAHVFPPGLFDEGRTYVSEDVKIDIAKKILEGYSIIVK